MGNSEWKWTKTENDAFESLKCQIMDDITLVIPNDNRKFHVEADSSNFANGAILSQQVDGKWRPVGF